MAARQQACWATLALTAALLAFFAIPANAQLFSDRPPPVPPAAVPDPGAAVSLAPPSGPGSRAAAAAGAAAPPSLPSRR